MASTSLTKTFSSAGNRKTWTWSGWVKKQIQSSGNMNLFDANDNSSDRAGIILDNNQLRFFATGCDVKLSPLLRDVSAWYHIVVAVDTTQATDTNRIKFYINGEQITSYTSATWYSQNTDGLINNNVEHGIGVDSLYNNQYFDGSMAHIHFIDGTQYAASDFGETDATTGIWKPKTAPSVTYGTNGFFLKFENSGSMGTDSSGNGNNFTVNGTMTQTIDTPSNVFATMNPLVPSTNITFSNGNNRLTGSQSDNYSQNTISTLGVSSGKWYCEAKYTTANVNTNANVGIATLENFRYDVNNTAVSGFANVRFDGQLYVDGSAGTATYWGSNPVAGDIIMFALDMDNGKFYLGKNGTWENSGDPTSGSTGTGSITSSRSGTQAINVRYLASVFDFNFGNGYFGTTAVASAQNPDDGIGIFEYSVPTGYKALCTKSINAQEYS